MAKEGEGSEQEYCPSIRNKESGIPLIHIQGELSDYKRDYYSREFSHREQHAEVQGSKSHILFG